MTTLFLHDFYPDLEVLNFEFQEVSLRRGSWALRKGLSITFGAWNELLHRRLAEVVAASSRSKDYFDISLVQKLAEVILELLGFLRHSNMITEDYWSSNLHEETELLLKLVPEIRQFEDFSAFQQVWTLRCHFSFVRKAHPDGQETIVSMWASMLVYAMDSVIENPKGEDSTFQTVLAKFNAARKLAERSESLRLVFGELWNDYRRSQYKKTNCSFQIPKKMRQDFIEILPRSGCSAH